MGPKITNELLEFLELGSLSREHTRTVYNSFHPQVDVFKDASLERSISTCNKKKIVHQSFNWMNSSPGLNDGLVLLHMSLQLLLKQTQRE
jgi:hypothetical protein